MSGKGFWHVSGGHSNSKLGPSYLEHDEKDIELAVQSEHNEFVIRKPTKVHLTFRSLAQAHFNSCIWPSEKGTWAVPLGPDRGANEWSWSVDFLSRREGDEATVRQLESLIPA